MNGVGPGYGDAAYRALSVFLVVAVNKSETEDIIETMLSTLQEQFRRIQLLKRVHGTPEMKRQTATVYRLGIEFLHEAVSIQLMNKVSEIRGAIKEMRKEIETLDAVRLEKVEQAVTDLSEDVGDLRQRIKAVNINVGNIGEKANDIELRVENVENGMEALHLRKDHSRLQALKQVLQLSDEQVDAPIRNYEILLAETFEGFRKLPPLDVAEGVFSTAIFQNWRKYRGPRTLVLHGSTVAPEDTELCWLSPAAVSLVATFNKLFEDDGTVLIKYFCRTTEDPCPSEVLTAIVVSSLIWQILRSGPGKLLLRDEERFKTVSQRLNAIISRSEENGPMRTVERLLSVFQGVVKDIRLEKLVIVIDRVDQIWGRLDWFLRPMLHLFKGEDREVKLFLTLKDQDGRLASDLRQNFGRGAFLDLLYDQNAT